MVLRGPAWLSVLPTWLFASYHRCCERASGIARGLNPTLRHNYIARALMRWVDEGKDIEARPPYFAASTRHQMCTSTSWYDHLLPQRLAATGLTRAVGINAALTS